MNIIWSYIEHHAPAKTKWKNRLFLTLIPLIAGLIGAAARGLILRHFLPGTDWELFFILAPAVTMWFVSAIYLMNHPFTKPGIKDPSFHKGGSFCL